MADATELYIDRYFGPEYPELLQLIGTEIFVSLMEDPSLKALGEDRLAAMCFRVTEQVRSSVGGTSLYIAKGQQYEVSRRDRQIWQQFRGDNYDALAIEHGLSTMRIRQIIKRVRTAELRKRQSDLFAQVDAEQVGTGN